MDLALRPPKSARVQAGEAFPHPGRELNE